MLRNSVRIDRFALTFDERHQIIDALTGHAFAVGRDKLVRNDFYAVGGSTHVYIRHADFIRCRAVRVFAHKGHHPAALSGNGCFDGFTADEKRFLNVGFGGQMRRTALQNAKLHRAAFAADLVADEVFQIFSGLLQ